jgi:L-ascorbate metabolism protein UlaG (beta-lactamase superfamily)
MDRLTYIGHATTLLRSDRLSVLTDPVLGNWIGFLHRQGKPPDRHLLDDLGLAVLSHLHRDHLDIPSLRRLPASTPLIVPKGAAKWAARGRLRGRDIREIDVGETVALGGVGVTAVPAKHDGHRNLPHGRSIRPLGYLIRTPRVTVYFPGDTDVYPEMSSFGSVDLALLPVWGWGPTLGPGHMNPERAAEALRLIRPRLAIPIHWGSLYPVGLRKLRPAPLSEPPNEFKRFAAELAPDVEVRVLQPSETTTLEGT